MGILTKILILFKTRGNEASYYYVWSLWFKHVRMYFNVRIDWRLNPTESNGVNKFSTCQV